MVFVVGILFSCQPKDTVYTGQSRDQAVVEHYCQSCHLLPEPGQLTKRTWEKVVLPKMGYFLGVSDDFFQPQSPAKNELNAHLFPTTPLISTEEWTAIKRYFLTLAPDTLAPQPARPPIQLSISHFKARELDYKLLQPATMLVKIDPSSRRIYFGDAARSILYTSEYPYRSVDSIAIPTGPVQLTVRDSSFQLLTMGTLLPSDQSNGMLQQFSNRTSQPTLVLDRLSRPVQVVYADLNQDRQEDILVCGFGYFIGSFEWYEHRGQGKPYRKHILNPVTGAVHAVVQDFNSDQLPDILVLMAQGSEGLDLYINEGNNIFSAPERLLRFPPTFGSNYFEIGDFNQDGHWDIMATNGDNGDYTPILKNYHGIRIYQNDGNNHFAEQFFYPVHGIHKALARDFDLDGDLDIAAIAYFPDLQHLPEESFVYLANKGNLSYEGHSLPQHNRGRWMVMDAEDMDQDGDTDLLLGSSIFPLYRNEKQWQQPSSPVLIIENTTKTPNQLHASTP